MWRPIEQPLLEKEPYEFESRLVVPILIAECAKLLLESDGAALVAAREPLGRRVGAQKRVALVLVEGVIARV